MRGVRQHNSVKETSATEPAKRKEGEERSSGQGPARGFNHDLATIPVLPPAPPRNETGLPDRLKNGIEALSGLSFDKVRVHYNSSRPAQLQAHAYTKGTDIHMAPNQERHLPHEAWHVVQQARGQVRATARTEDGTALNDDKGLEREADEMGRRAATARSGVGTPREAPPAGEIVQRKERSQAERQALVQSPFQVSALQCGTIKTKAAVRDHGLKQIAELPMGSVIFYDDKIRDKFRTSLGLREKDHVYAMAITGGVTHHGWISYEKIEPKDELTKIARERLERDGTEVPEMLRSFVEKNTRKRPAKNKELSPDQRRDLARNPFQASALLCGVIKDEATLRDHDLKEIAKLPANSLIFYDGKIRDNFSTYFGRAEKDHVYARAIDRDLMHEGWIVYEKVSPNKALTIAAREKVGADAPSGKMLSLFASDQTEVAKKKAEEANEAARKAREEAMKAAEAALQAAGEAVEREKNPEAKKLAEKDLAKKKDAKKKAEREEPPKKRVWPASRVDLVPRAIGAWAEKEGNDLSQEMDLDLVTGAERHGQIEAFGDGNKSEYATIDPRNSLGLERLNKEGDMFKAFSGLLNANAKAMPGTMGKDHELRSESLGGDRAKAGHAWLRASGVEKPGDAELIAVTGASVTNIFINRKTPTWAAYNQNVKALAQQIQPPAFEPWKILQDRNPLELNAFVASFTQPRPGEHFLFHGTSKNNVFNITKTGFDPEFVNFTPLKGYGKTGYGTAFTDQFAKALAYAPPEKVTEAGADGPKEVLKHYVVVARVFAGNPYDVGDQGRRTRGNLELTESNINYEVARGNKNKAQGDGKITLGQTSDTVGDRLVYDKDLHSTLQHRDFDLTLKPKVKGDGKDEKLPTYRDTSLTVSDAIQMYPMYIIEATIPREHVREGQREKPAKTAPVKSAAAPVPEVPISPAAGLAR